MKNKIISLLNQEVKPALGCTEPIAVALATAKCCEILRSIGEEPSNIEASVSANILKNGMGVGIPGTGMVGLHIAVAIASLIGKSEYGLEVLKDLKAEDVVKAKKMIEENRIKISLAPTDEKLYICCTALSASHKAEAIINGSHDHFIKASLDGKDQLENAGSDSSEEKGQNNESSIPEDFAKTLTVSDIVNFASSTPLEDLEFIMESERLNKALVEEGLKHKYGLQVGQTIMAGKNSRVFGDSLLAHAMAYTAAASDARMAGCTLPAMSNSGSGNQGITVTVPVIAVAQQTGANREQLIRALTLAHLVAIHIKGHLGRLSALCGCVIASTGASCGIVYLRGGGYKQICSAIKNMIGNITGMVCDGAKEGCAMKVASGVACALQSAVLALDDICISSNDGIIEDDIEKTISNLGRIGSVGMQTTDRMILDIMVCK